MVSVWTLVRMVRSPGMVAGHSGRASGPAALAPVVAEFASAGGNVTTQSKATITHQASGFYECQKWCAHCIH